MLVSLTHLVEAMTNAVNPKCRWQTKESCTHEDHPDEGDVAMSEVVVKKTRKKSKRKSPDGPKKPSTSPWIAHVKQYRVMHPEMDYRACLKNAVASYTPVPKKVKVEPPAVAE